MIKIRYKVSFLFISLIALINLSNCKREKINTNSSAKLNFSDDVILFDTVFTTIGSSTQYLKVYNIYKSTLIIKSIQLAKGSYSNFRLNVNGEANNKFEEIELLPNDSIFIFIEVTVDPTNINSPMLVNDSIIFETNGNLQDVDLIAWGQDAYYHYPTHFNQNGYNYSEIQTETWTNDKPHLIYGYVKIDSSNTLNIDAGCRIHFHNKSGLWVSTGSSLVVNGSIDNTVKFSGDRLESYYTDIPGQWDGIYFENGHNTSSINYAEIKNATDAILVEQSNTFSSPILTLSNSTIKNISKNAIYGSNASILAHDCLIFNCGNSAITLNNGGSYEFFHCTIGNYWNYSIRRNPSVYISNRQYDYDGNTISSSLEKCNINNCIIWGSLSDNEIYLDRYGENNYNVKFENSLVKIELENQNIQYFTNCKINTNPDFSDYSKNDYSLKSTSSAINNANINISNLFPTDLRGKNRLEDGLPDLGAIEYKP